MGKAGAFDAIGVGFGTPKTKLKFAGQKALLKVWDLLVNVAGIEPSRDISEREERKRRCSPLQSPTSCVVRRRSNSLKVCLWVRGCVFRVLFGPTSSALGYADQHHGSNP